MRPTTRRAAQPVGWAYEMRPITTGAARADATALVQDRALWLTHHGLTTPVGTTDAFRDPKAEAVGLYETGDGGEELLAGCLLLHRHPDLSGWGPAVTGPGLLASRVHTAPGRAQAGWLITMWLRDHAARSGNTAVYAEIPGRMAATSRLLEHTGDLGWEPIGSGRNTAGGRVTRLRVQPRGRSHPLHRPRRPRHLPSLSPSGKRPMTVLSWPGPALALPPVKTTRELRLWRADFTRTAHHHHAGALPVVRYAPHLPGLTPTPTSPPARAAPPLTA
ncbi:hypothetical protein [Streptomyces sp. NPDC091278]|uniref:hypothetical protein n=1 Tax=Streptomyces sp. NPDC091278 TaxID=3155301 RepID=UPI00344B7961